MDLHLFGRGKAVGPEKTTVELGVRQLMPSTLMPGNSSSRILVVLASSMLVSGLISTRSQAGWAADHGDDDVNVRLGLDDKFKLGHWTFVRVDFGPRSPLSDGFRGELIVTVPDDEGVSCSFRANVESTSDGVTGYLKVGRPQGELRVEIHPRSGPSWSENFPLDGIATSIRNRQQHLLIMGDNEDLMDVFALKTNSREQLIVSHVTSPEELPNQWYGYDGLDAMVLLTNAPEFYGELTADQSEAIRMWVAQGGRVLVSCGDHAKQLLSNRSLVSELTDLSLLDVVPLSQTTELESYAGASQRLDLMLRESIDEGKLNVAVVQAESGRSLIREGRGDRAVPVVLQQSHGFGQVLFVAVDLNDPRLGKWTGHGKLVRKLLVGLLGNTRDSIPESDQGQLTHLGFDDISGQLHATLDQFPGVRLIPFSWVAALAVVYVVLVGPAEYLLRRQSNDSPRYAWIVLPTMVVGCSGLVMALNHYWKGNRSMANKVEIVDVDTVSGLVRGTTWSHLYSAESKRRNVSLVPQLEAPFVPRTGAILFSWDGLAGDSFGGMAHPGSLAARGFAGYEISIQQQQPDDYPTSVIKGIPMPRSSTRATVGRWWNEQAVVGDSETMGALEETIYEQLKGTLRNTTPWKWQNSLLFFHGWYYNLGTIQPGQEVSLSNKPYALSLPKLLGRRKIVETKGITTPWKKDSMNLPRIMEMMMWHDAAEGRAYTDLLHRQQRFLDMSDLLASGRAVVVAKVEKPVTELEWDGDEVRDESGRSRTYLRVVYSVALRN